MENSTSLTSEQINQRSSSAKIWKAWNDMDRRTDPICLIGAFAYYRQLKYGLVVTTYAGLRFMGNLYFQFCILCRH